MHPTSQLIHARVQDGTGSPRVITLHKHRQFAEDVRSFALAAAPDAHIIGLESYKGVYVGKTIVGYTWYVGPLQQPAPIFYGDALAEIERFLWDEIDRQVEAGISSPELPFLFGIEQGAIIALGCAAAFPDLLSGVIAIEGTFPLVPGWEPPLVPLDGLPILIVDPAESETISGSSVSVLIGETLASTLTAWGGEVTRFEVEHPAIPAPGMRTWLEAQPIRTVDAPDGA